MKILKEAIIYKPGIARTTSSSGGGQPTEDSIHGKYNEHSYNHHYLSAIVHNTSLPLEHRMQANYELNHASNEMQKLANHREFNPQRAANEGAEIKQLFNKKQGIVHTKKPSTETPKGPVIKLKKNDDPKGDQAIRDFHARRAAAWEKKVKEADELIRTRRNTANNLISSKSAVDRANEGEEIHVRGQRVNKMEEDKNSFLTIKLLKEFIKNGDVTLGGEEEPEKRGWNSKIGTSLQPLHDHMMKNGWVLIKAAPVDNHATPEEKSAIHYYHLAPHGGENSFERHITHKDGKITHIANVITTPTEHHLETFSIHGNGKKTLKRTTNEDLLLENDFLRKPMPHELAVDDYSVDGIGRERKRNIIQPVNSGNGVFTYNHAPKTLKSTVLHAMQKTGKINSETDIGNGDHYISHTHPEHGRTLHKINVGQDGFVSSHKFQKIEQKPKILPAKNVDNFHNVEVKSKKDIKNQNFSLAQNHVGNSHEILRDRLEANGYRHSGVIPHSEAGGHDHKYTDDNLHHEITVHEKDGVVRNVSHDDRSHRYLMHSLNSLKKKPPSITDRKVDSGSGPVSGWEPDKMRKEVIGPADDDNVHPHPIKTGDHPRITSLFTKVVGQPHTPKFLTAGPKTPPPEPVKNPLPLPDVAKSANREPLDAARIAKTNRENKYDPKWLHGLVGKRVDNYHTTMKKNGYVNHSEFLHEKKHPDGTHEKIAHEVKHDPETKVNRIHSLHVTTTTKDGERETNHYQRNFSKNTFRE